MTVLALFRISWLLARSNKAARRALSHQEENTKVEGL